MAVLPINSWFSFISYFLVIITQTALTWKCPIGHIRNDVILFPISNTVEPRYFEVPREMKKSSK